MNEKVLMIVDRPIKRGVELGLYPSWKSAIDCGSLVVLAYDEWQHQIGLRLDSKPCGINDIYVFNPYSNVYLRAVDNADLMDEFYMGKSFVIKEAFVMMGAKHIVLRDEVIDKDNLQGSTGVKASTSTNNNGSLNATFNKLNSTELKTKIESHDDNRKARNAEDVREFLNSRGLVGDEAEALQLLCDRLEKDGYLSGEESYTLTFYKEIEKAINVLSTLDCSVFNSSLDFSRDHNHIQKITKEIYVNFDRKYLEDFSL